MNSFLPSLSLPGGHPEGTTVEGPGKKLLDSQLVTLLRMDTGSRMFRLFSSAVVKMLVYHNMLSYGGVMAFSAASFGPALYLHREDCVCFTSPAQGQASIPISLSLKSKDYTIVTEGFLRAFNSSCILGVWSFTAHQITRTKKCPHG